MKNAISEYLGKKLWNLTVVGLDPEYIGRTYNANRWLFQCDCGKIFSAAPSRVLSGHKKSCGCRKVTQNTIHGVNQDTYYPTWWGMMRRCYHKENHNYARYGGRGITVCKEWHNPVAFIEWAHKTGGEKSSDLTLDRIDNDQGYSPENCRWVSPSTQSNNRRNTLMVSYNGEMVPVAQLAREHGLNVGMVRARIFDLGWPIEEALSKPPRAIRHRWNKTTSGKRPKKSICINGVYKTVTEWCKEFGTSRDIALQRISRGWDPELAIKTPRKSDWGRGRKAKKP